MTHSNKPVAAREDRGLIAALRLLWTMLTQRRRWQLVTLIGLTIVAAFLEVASLGMLLPFLALVVSPLQESPHPVVQQITQMTGMTDLGTLAFLALLAFSAMAIMAGMFRLLVLVANNHFAFSLATEIGQNIYRRALFQPYVSHLSENSSRLVDASVNKSLHITSNIVAQALNLSSAAFIGTGIVIAITATDPLIAISVGILFSSLYGAIIFFTRTALKRNGEVISSHSARAIRSVQEGLGGIRDVIIDGTQEAYVAIFRAADHPFKMAMSWNAVIAGTPRFIVEMVGMVFIASLAYLFSRSANIADAIPALGVLALGAQRLMPMLQQSYAAVATIRGSEPVLWEVLDLLGRPLPDKAGAALTIPFQREIVFEGVGFLYPTTKRAAVEHVDLAIPKGSKVGVFGPTGGGKSTTLDIIMGLLEPTSGCLRVDDVKIDTKTQAAWRRHISHVPQAIFLSDGSVAENIAFGVPRTAIDMDRVRWAAELAQLSGTILQWPDQYDTLVGERGVRLSGGQRQRIGVARAFYKRADVIILDEATSALDDETEAALMMSVEQLGADVTVLMVAHRLTTLKNCDFVVEIRDGTIAKKGPYKELIGSWRADGNSGHQS